MQRAGSHKGRWQNAVFLLTALLVVVADQLSKAWIRSNLSVGQSLPEKGFFQLTHVRNTGAAFGLLPDQSFTLTIITSIGIAVLLFYAFLASRRFGIFDSSLGKLVLGLILGGAVGNLVDRIRSGYVTDFIGVGIWPPFNIADSAVVIGVTLVVYSLFSLVRVRKRGDEQRI